MPRPYKFDAGARQGATLAALLATLIAVLVFVNRRRFGELVLNEAVFEFFAGDASRLQSSGIFNERRRTGHDLAGAPRRKDHIRKLALRSFCLHSHFSHSPQTMPEVLPPVV